MAIGPNDRYSMTSRTVTGVGAQAGIYDEGLRKYMLQVYNYMASGLALTGIIAYVSANTPAILNLLYAPTPTGGIAPTMLAWIVMLAPLGFILVLSFGIQRMQASTAQAIFWAFAAVMGLSLAHIFLTFTGTSIARVFFITSGAFAALSLYGYTTKRDLSAFGTFLMIGLFGIIIASIVNIFLQSSAMQFVISVVGVLVFAGLTAYDTQKIKAIYDGGDSSETYSKKAIMGAVTLYLDFINMFIMLLHLFGDRR
jgi:FtsH-binding integral membrane protein